MISHYPETPDPIILDWYAGAYAERNHPDPEPDDEWDWRSGDACLSFRDIGVPDGRHPHAQIVLNFLGYDGRVRAISMEIDRNDAVQILNTVGRWFNETTE